MEFVAMGSFDERKVTVKWKNGKIHTSKDILEKIDMMDGSFVMDKAIPMNTVLDTKEHENIYVFLRDYFFDEEPEITGNIPIETGTVIY